MLELSFMLDELIKSYPEFKLLTNNYGIILVEKDSNMRVATIFGNEIPKRMTKAVRQEIYNRVKLSLETHYETYKELLGIVKRMDEINKTKLKFKIGNKEFYYEPREYSYILYIKNEYDKLAIEARYETIGETIKFKELTICNPEELNITIEKLNKILLEQVKLSKQLYGEYDELSKKNRELLEQITETY